VALSTNGKWTLANTILSFFTFAALALVGWMLSSVIELREFKAQGDRFTGSQASAMRQHILREVAEKFPPRWLQDDLKELKEETRRLQLQIDRLEGHDPKNYLQDVHPKRKGR